jgi:hypothetical protein
MHSPSIPSSSANYFAINIKEIFTYVFVIECYRECTTSFSESIFYSYILPIDTKIHISQLKHYYTHKFFSDKNSLLHFTLLRRHISSYFFLSKAPLIIIIVDKIFAFHNILRKTYSNTCIIVDKNTRRQSVFLTV